MPYIDKDGRKRDGSLDPMSSDILDKLRDLHKQATAERSHYYVASCCGEAISEIERLRSELFEAERIGRQWRDVVAQNMRKAK